jgi:hypothetical protein
MGQWHEEEEWWNGAAISKCRPVSNATTGASSAELPLVAQGRSG